MIFKSPEKSSAVSRHRTRSHGLVCLGALQEFQQHGELNKNLILDWQYAFVLFFLVTTSGTAEKKILINLLKWQQFLVVFLVIVFQSFKKMLEARKSPKKKSVANMTSPRGKCCCVSAHSDWLRPDMFVCKVLQNCSNWPNRFCELHRHYCACSPNPLLHSEQRLGRHVGSWRLSIDTQQAAVQTLSP